VPDGVGEPTVLPVGRDVAATDGDLDQLADRRRGGGGGDGGFDDEPLSEPAKRGGDL